MEKSNANHNITIELDSFNGENPIFNVNHSLLNEIGKIIVQKDYVLISFKNDKKEYYASSLREATEEFYSIWKSRRYIEMTESLKHSKPKACAIYRTDIVPDATLSETIEFINSL